MFTSSFSVVVWSSVFFFCLSLSSSLSSFIVFSFFFLFSLSLNLRFISSFLRLFIFLCLSLYLSILSMREVKENWKSKMMDDKHGNNKDEIKRGGEKEEYRSNSHTTTSNCTWRTTEEITCWAHVAGRVASGNTSCNC